MYLTLLCKVFRHDGVIVVTTATDVESAVFHAVRNRDTHSLAHAYNSHLFHKLIAVLDFVQIIAEVMNVGSIHQNVIKVSQQVLVEVKSLTKPLRRWYIVRDWLKPSDFLRNVLCVVLSSCDGWESRSRRRLCNNLVLKVRKRVVREVERRKRARSAHCRILLRLLLIW